MAIFSCQPSSTTPGTSVLIVADNVECWSGIHIFYCALFTISLLLYLILFILISVFYNESRPYHTDAFARLDTNFETYVTLYKLLITVIGHFVSDPKMHWLIIIIHILGSLNFAKMYLKFLPYYNIRTSVLFGSGWFIYFWISLNVLITKALE